MATMIPLALLRGLKFRTLNGRLLLHAPKIETTTSDSGKNDIHEKGLLPTIAGDTDSVELVASLTPKGTHKPTLDIDMPCVLEPSSTDGRFHLFIDKELTDAQYEKLLDVLVEVGIVQDGVRTLQFKNQGFTAVRVPGTKKKYASGTVKIKPGFLKEDGEGPTVVSQTVKELIEDVQQEDPF